MSNHRISGLADPTDPDDAVTMRYVSSRFQALSVKFQDQKSKLDALQNFLGIENNQILIRKYEIIGSNFERFITYGEEGRVTKVVVVKAPRPRDDTSEFGFIDIFTLKEYFFYLLEEPVDDVTWLRIKQPGTYTLHFDIISGSNSFSFGLDTRGKRIHFIEHNPKRNINLEKGENCYLRIERIQSTTRAGSEIYVYYNI